MQCRMGRIKLKIKRLETTDSILDTYAKRKSKIMIQEALLKEEEQKARVKEFEARLNKYDAELIRSKELKNKADDLTAMTKNMEAYYYSNKNVVASLHKTSKDPESLRGHDALLKRQEAIVKTVEGRKKVFDELVKIGDYLPFEKKEKLASDVDVERAKLKQFEQNRKEIEKGAYLAIREGLRNKLAYDLDVERAKVKQLEQNTKEVEKGASLTSKESLENKLASDIDVERAYAKQLEKNQKEIMFNSVEPGKDQFVKDVGQTLVLNTKLPMSMEEANSFDTVKDDKIVSIQIGEMNVPLCEPSLLAAQPKKPPANP